MKLVDSVVGVGGRVHEGDVPRRSSHGHVLIVDGRAVFGAEDVDLAALDDVDFVQSLDIGNAGSVAQVRFEQGDGISRGVVHGEASVGLLGVEALAVVALRHRDPERVVVGKGQAAYSTGSAVTDGDRASGSVVGEIE